MRTLARAFRGGIAKRHDGCDEDDFFEPELFHEAFPRAGSNLLVRSRRVPGRLLAEALSSMRCFLGSRGEAEISDQPRVLAYLKTVFNQRYGKDAGGLRTSREMRSIAESIDALMEGTSFELATFSYNASRLWKPPLSTALGRWPVTTSLFQKKASDLPRRRSGRPFRGWSSSGGSSRKRSARNIESKARRELGRERSWRRGGSKDAGTKGDAQAWTGKPTLEEVVDISCAQAALCANKKKFSRWRLWGCTCWVLSRRGRRPSEICSRGAADVLCDRQSLEELRAAQRPHAAASSLELGVIRRVFAASR